MEEIKPVDEETIDINLNGNKLSMTKKGGWRLQSEDFQMALLEISRLVEEKEQLGKSLEVALYQIEALSEEVREVNQMKKAVLEMVRLGTHCNYLIDLQKLIFDLRKLMNERQERLALENQIEGYKMELRDNCRLIVEMRFVRYLFFFNSMM